MELDAAKRLIKKHTIRHAEMIARTLEAEDYHKNKNRILKGESKKDEKGNPLRNADNRIPHNFYGLLVNQKAAYMFTSPPLFDVGNDEANKKIAEVLGDKWAKTCKRLCTNAANSYISWLHIWADNEGNFKYGVVDSKQVIPVWGSDLEETLLAVLRVYNQILDDGESYDIYEYWTANQCQSFKKKADETIDEGLSAYTMFKTFLDDGNLAKESDTINHSFGRVPFIPFFNNDIGTRDIDSVKQLIDTYDKVYSGFANDLEDIQEIIFILSGYGGESLSEFMSNIKKYKTIKVDSSDDKNAGVQTITIDIPVEAREKLLAMTRKAIFEQGQGVDPDPSNFGNASGVALKYLYSLLELKAGLAETEFRLGFGTLVRMICDFYHIKCNSIIQTWTRAAIQNDLEQSQICQNSVGIVSDKSIRKAHPLVEDIATEEKQIEEEKKKEEEEFKPTVVNKAGVKDEE